MNLKDKLARHHRKLASEEHELQREPIPREPETRRIPEHWIQLAELTGGEIQRSGNGFYFYRFKKYPFYNDSTVNLFLREGFEAIGLKLIVPEIENETVNLKDCIYFDLETSGISGGTGTLAFLIGAAHFDETGISVHQWILPDFSFEHLILEQFHNMVARYKGIVSFNGKTFDVPVMRNRYRLNRLEAELDEKIHLDLLHPARRIWGKRLGSCKLQNLEKEILNEYRQEDIPAELIPSVFFNFLYGEGLDQFKIILEHNYLDLVNLVKLSLEMENMLRQPALSLKESIDFLQLLNYLYKRNQFEMIVELTQDYGCRDELWPKIQQICAMAAKKLADHTTAAELFESLLFEHKHWDPSVVVEYAKILEHHLKNYTRAREVLNRARQQFEILAELREKQFSPVLDEIEHRLNRIEIKMRKSGLGTT